MSRKTVALVASGGCCVMVLLLLLVIFLLPRMIFGAGVALRDDLSGTTLGALGVVSLVFVILIWLGCYFVNRELNTLSVPLGESLSPATFILYSGLGIGVGILIWFFGCLAEIPKVPLPRDAVYWTRVKADGEASPARRQAADEALGKLARAEARRLAAATTRVWELEDFLFPFILSLPSLPAVWLIFRWGKDGLSFGSCVEIAGGGAFSLAGFGLLGWILAAVLLVPRQVPSELRPVLQMGAFYAGCLVGIPLTPLGIYSLLRERSDTSRLRSVGVSLTWLLAVGSFLVVLVTGAFQTLDDVKALFSRVSKRSQGTHGEDLHRIQDQRTQHGQVTQEPRSQEEAFLRSMMPFMTELEKLRSMDKGTSRAFRARGPQRATVELAFASIAEPGSWSRDYTNLYRMAKDALLYQQKVESGQLIAGAPAESYARESWEKLSKEFGRLCQRAGVHR